MTTINIPNPMTETRSNSRTADTMQRAADGMPAPVHAANEAVSPGKQTVAFSSLAQQLSEAASRAAARDTGMTRQELATKGKALTDIIVGPDYWAKKTIHDAEVPKTGDPLHLARAQQATAFANFEGPNPFKGMNREQLSLIAYDESGTFTVNERRAAWCEAYDQDEAQRRILCAKIVDEYNRTGKVVDSLLDVLKFYKSLPAIDQAMQFPADYEAQLRSRILAGGSSESLEELSSILGLGAELDFKQISQSKDANATLKLSFNA